MSRYYDRFPAQEVPRRVGFKPNPIPPAIVGRVHCVSSENMPELPDESIGLVFTSPPYHVGEEYDTDASWDEHLALLLRVFRECYRVLEPGAAMVVNVANLGRKPYIRYTDATARLLTEAGFLHRGEVIWEKFNRPNTTAWGSFESPKAPTIRDVHEYLLIAVKDQFGRARDGEATITREEFIRDTSSIWYEPAAAPTSDHPAPFPVGLASRVIRLFAYRDDVVLDPFMGSGSTAVAAERNGNPWVGYEKEPAYALVTARRIREERMSQTVLHLPLESEEGV